MSLFVSPEKVQTTKATIGLGNVTVGGINLDEQGQFADLNRDITNSQEIMRNKTPTSQSLLYRGI